MRQTVTAIAVLFMLGCQLRPVTAPPAEPFKAAEELTAPLAHRVRASGETLSSIASWYTGRSAYWRQIADYNPQIDPHRIQIGTTIYIPGELLITERPMPLPKPPVVAVRQVAALQPKQEILVEREKVISEEDELRQKLWAELGVTP